MNVTPVQTSDTLLLNCEKVHLQPPHKRNLVYETSNDLFKTQRFVSQHQSHVQPFKQRALQLPSITATYDLSKVYNELKNITCTQFGGSVIKHKMVITSKIPKFRTLFQSPIKVKPYKATTISAFKLKVDREQAITKLQQRISASKLDIEIKKQELKILDQGQRTVIKLDQASPRLPRDLSNTSLLSVAFKSPKYNKDLHDQIDLD